MKPRQEAPGFSPGRFTNPFCDLDEAAVLATPQKFHGLLLSNFVAEKNGFVLVPADTFKDMIDIIAEAAVAATVSELSDDLIHRQEKLFI